MDCVYCGVRTLNVIQVNLDHTRVKQTNCGPYVCKESKIHLRINGPHKPVILFVVGLYICYCGFQPRKVPIPLPSKLLCPKLQRDFLRRVQTTCLTAHPALICQGGGTPSYHRISN